MIKIDLIDLIYIVPDIMNLFLAGFIFITLFSWLNSKNYDNTILIVWSLVISYIIKIFYSAVHSIFFTDIDINEYVKLLTYIITSVGLSFFVTKLLDSRILRRILYKTNNKSINDDIFDDIIDYEKPTMMSIYLKSSDIYYVGKYCYREEKGLDSWIVLINYCCANKSNNKIIYDPKKENKKSTVMINLHDIERIENIYEENSEVWKHLSDEEEQESN